MLFSQTLPTGGGSLMNSLFCSVVVAVVVTAGAREEVNLAPTWAQGKRLISAIWHEPIRSIDLTIHKKVIAAGRSIESLREEVRKDLDERAAVAKEMMDKHAGGIVFKEPPSFDKELARRVAIHNSPRFMEERIRIDGEQYRLDQKRFGSDDRTDEDATPSTTYVNCGAVTEGDFTHFSYEHQSARAVISDNKGTVWREHKINDWRGIPADARMVLRLALGEDDASGPTDNAIGKLVSAALENDISVTISEGEDDAVSKHWIHISIRSSGSDLYRILVDAEDYSRVFVYETYRVGTGQLQYRRETGEFDAQGFPRSVHTTSYDDSGNVREEEWISVDRVELNPSLTEGLFKFKAPVGYTSIDERFSPALIIEPEEEEVPDLGKLGAEEKVPLEGPDGVVVGDPGTEVPHAEEDAEANLSRVQGLPLLFLITSFFFVCAGIYRFKRKTT